MSQTEKMGTASICDFLQHPWPQSLAAEIKRSKCVCWGWSMLLLKDRSRGKQRLVQRGSVTLHVNDTSAAGSSPQQVKGCSHTLRLTNSDRLAEKTCCLNWRVGGGQLLLLLPEAIQSQNHLQHVAFNSKNRAALTGYIWICQKTEYRQTKGS